jgi:hypothetical protein
MPKGKSRLGLSDYFYLLLGAGIIIYAAYRISYNAIADHILTSGTKQLKAVIGYDKNFTGNSPVSNTFSYSYVYTVNGVTYKGNSYDPKLQPGDTVDIVYSPEHPSMSKMVERK